MEHVDAIPITPRKPKHPRFEAQIATSRSSPSKSPGPKTPEGKAISRMNTLKHGLCGEFVLLPGESHSVHRDLQDAYIDRFLPQDAVEFFAVEQLDKLDWEIGRASSAQRNSVILRVDDHRARQVELQTGEFGEIMERHLGRLDRAYARTVRGLYPIRTWFPLPSDQRSAGTESVNLRNEPKPPATPIESTSPGPKSPRPTPKPPPNRPN